MNPEQVTNQQRMEFANSFHVNTVLEILRRCSQSSNIESLIGKDEYSTMLNAIIVETETSLLRSFANEIVEIKKGKIYDK